MLAALFGLLAVGSATVAVLPRPDTATPGTSAATTPVFSVRRVAGVISRTIAASRLRADLDEILADGSLGGARDNTCLAVRDPSGRTVYDHHSDLSVIPASTLKLVTAATVLTRMGSDARYTTEVRAAAPPTDGGVNDLWLVGSGDPLLATADYAAVAGWMETPRTATSIEALADRVSEAGVRRIGRVIGDESRYDTQRYIPSWEPTYASSPEVGPQSALTVNDGYVQWRPGKVPASSPATHGATILANLLRSRGVSVGGVGEGRAPDGAVAVASVDSPPMAEVVGVILTHSGNLTSELLVKELGARFGGAGTTAAGVEVMRSTLPSLGVAAEGVQAVDGSGLDRSDRLTCHVLQTVLGRAGDSSPLARGLSVAGESGTLIRRFNGTPAVGKVRAKTGSLHEVVGLSGWATGLDGRSLLFSLVANELPSEAAGTALQDKIASALVTYPEAPAPDDIDPEPVRGP
jgi:D-alanyl-D-alanine carboxypeptidase/D-alanyl-D-alanine-endopeptidase (penicillin-binding protein 4)